MRGIGLVEGVSADRSSAAHTIPAAQTIPDDITGDQIQALQFDATRLCEQAAEHAAQHAADPAAARPARHRIVVVGAGPVGLSLAIDLAQRGQKVLLLDNDDRLSTGSRAI